MKICGIYRWYNTANGRSYVGSSIDIAMRKNNHRYLLGRGKSHSPKLQRAWDKYGADAFVFEILELCVPADLMICEAKWLTKFDAVQQGYNCSSDVASPRRGMPHSPESRERMRMAQQRPRTAAQMEAARANLVAHNRSLRGKAQTAEHRQKIGDAHRGKSHSPETRERMRGRQVSPETLALLRGRKRSAVARERMRLAHLGKPNPSRMRPVLQCGADGTPIGRFPSTKDAARALGMRRESITNCLNRRSKSAGGFCWQYAE